LSERIGPLLAMALALCTCARFALEHPCPSFEGAPGIAVTVNDVPPRRTYDSGAP
jgi:hypothetical protein